MKQYNLGIEATLEIIGGKWKALIICLLMSGREEDRRAAAQYRRHFTKGPDSAIT